MRPRECRYCGDRFTPAYEMQMRCGSKCRIALNAQEKKEAERNKPKNLPKRIESKKPDAVLDEKAYQKKKEQQARWNENMRNKALEREKNKRIDKGKDRINKVMNGRKIDDMGSVAKIVKFVKNGKVRSFVVRKRSKGEGKFQYVCVKIRKRQIEKKGYYYCEHPGCTYQGNHLYYENHHIVYRSEKPLHKYLHHILNILRLCPYHHDWYEADKARRNWIVRVRGLESLFGTLILRPDAYALLIISRLKNERNKTLSHVGE